MAKKRLWYCDGCLKKEVTTDRWWWPFPSLTAPSWILGRGALYIHYILDPRIGTNVDGFDTTEEDSKFCGYVYHTTKRSLEQERR